jgi:preprotein translocase subunit SecE
MAKTALVAGEQPNDSKQNQLTEKVSTQYDRARNFLSDVRVEMRKVVTPSRKEVEATTTVVLVTVFVFALFFWIVDSVFIFGLNQLMTKLVGPQ